MKTILLINRSGDVVFHHQVAFLISESKAYEQTIRKAHCDGIPLLDLDLSYLNLSNINLCDVKLPGARFIKTNLTCAHLRYMDLEGASFRDMDLTGADLVRSNLSSVQVNDVDLTGANLEDAFITNSIINNSNLTRANFEGAILHNTDLRDCTLKGAILTPYRDDLWAVLSATPHEVYGLQAALLEGRVDGTTYSGECACLVGTLANLQGREFDTIPRLTPNACRPIENFFFSIRKGDTPATSEYSALALSWVNEWLSAMHSAFGVAPGGAA